MLARLLRRRERELARMRNWDGCVFDRVEFVIGGHIPCCCVLDDQYGMAACGSFDRSGSAAAAQSWLVGGAQVPMLRGVTLMVARPATHRAS
jgi:hypothetical protein